MKKVAVLLLFVVGSLELCLAQGSKEAIINDPLKAAGSFYVYDYKDASSLTPAPKGYKPFYVSHFGRHGARYCTSEYDAVHGWFAKAAEKGLLTDEGKQFFSRYEKFYKKVRYSKGNLTGIGKEQHRKIAEHMFQRFPEVFEGPTHVEAVSTESARVIMSMWSFLSSLQSLDKDIDFNADASAKYASWLQPSLSSNPYYIKGGFSCNKATEDAVKDYFEANVPWKEIAGKFFVSPDVLEKDLKVTPEKFIETLHGVVTCTYCLDDDHGCLDDVFSSDELYKIWKGLSASYFASVANYEGSGNMTLDYSAFTLGQIIESADADIASGNTQLRLRFGHDSGIAPLLALLDVNGFGRATSSFEEGLEIFPSYNIPMGASLQLVFYRNDSGDILVKVLQNEQEGTLPLEAVSGPYYRWNDFKEHYMPIVRASKRNVRVKEPLAVLKATDWGWKPVGDTKAEAGSASVKVFGSTQCISMVRFPMSAHTVSVVESDGPDAAITSKFGENTRAIAAINGSYFDVDLLMPVTYVKDEGKVLCNVTTDGSYRCNGMFMIKDKKGRKVDIITVDSLGTAKAAKGWREAIISGPVLMEEGQVVEYEDDGTRLYRKFYATRHPRTLLGYTADGWMYFIVVDGRFPGQGEGMSIHELTVLCESLGLYEALNFDGGGSSTIWTKEDGVINHPYDNKKFDHEGERIVPNAIICK
ncbi:MAG: phosphodiester glycosidase family protein [Bacteroidota bacterium]|nr:phosphodiester glycosidase family protein [Bacteroidota bacterium]